MLLYFRCHAYERHSNAKGQINQKGQECKWMFLPISAAPVAKSKYAAGSMHFGRTGAFTQTHSLNIHIHPFTKSTTLSTPNTPALSCRPPSVHCCRHKSPSDSSSPSMAAQPWHPPLLPPRLSQASWITPFLGKVDLKETNTKLRDWKDQTFGLLKGGYFPHIWILASAISI